MTRGTYIRCGADGVKGCRLKVWRFAFFDGRRRGFCRSHYLRWHKYGDPKTLKRPARTTR